MSFPPFITNKIYYYRWNNQISIVNHEIRHRFVIMDNDSLFTIMFFDPQGYHGQCPNHKTHKNNYTYGSTESVICIKGYPIEIFLFRDESFSSSYFNRGIIHHSLNHCNYSPRKNSCKNFIDLPLCYFYTSGKNRKDGFLGEGQIENKKKHNSS